MEGFKKFLLRGNVLDLAVAVVVGAAFTAVVSALVKAILTPLVGMFGGIPDFAAWVVVVNNSRFLIGEFINAIVAFVVVAAVLYFLVVVPVNRLQERQAAATPAPAPTRPCPECLSEVPATAKRCRFCTSPLPA